MPYKILVKLLNDPDFILSVLSSNSSMLTEKAMHHLQTHTPHSVQYMTSVALLSLMPLALLHFLRRENCFIQQGGNIYPIFNISDWLFKV